MRRHRRRLHGWHTAIPVTPEQIANSALEAASAGAAIVHRHVREPETGKGVRNVDYYREVMERIRAKNTDVIMNLTAGMGGDLMIGDGESPRNFDEDNTDLVGPVERLLHVAELRLEICTLDCGSLNFGDTNSIVVQTPGAIARTGQADPVLWRETGNGNFLLRQSLVRQATRL